MPVECFKRGWCIKQKCTSYDAPFRFKILHRRSRPAIPNISTSSRVLESRTERGARNPFVLPACCFLSSRLPRGPPIHVKTCQGWRSWLYSSTRYILEALKYRLRIQECAVKRFLPGTSNMRNHNTPSLLFLPCIISFDLKSSPRSVISSLLSFFVKINRSRRVFIRN